MNTSTRVVMVGLITLIIILAAITGYLLGKDKEIAGPKNGIVMQESISSTKEDNKQMPQKNNNNNQEGMLYKNAQYGFQLVFPESWKGYIIKDGTTYGPRRGVTFGFAEQYNVLTVEVYTKDEWSEVQEKRQKGEIPGSGNVLGESEGYVFVEPFIFEAMPGLDKQFNDLDKIRKSFKIIN